MPNRKKRLKKGIESIGKQIILHEEKKRKAREEGKIELEQYYGKEMGNLEETREKKKELLEKS